MYVFQVDDTRKSMVVSILISSPEFKWPNSHKMLAVLSVLIWLKLKRKPTRISRENYFLVN